MSKRSPSDTLKEYRKKNKVSAIQLSRELNVSPARIYQWEAGAGISALRIQNWIIDPATPAHIRELARKMLGDEQPSTKSH